MGLHFFVFLTVCEGQPFFDILYKGCVLVRCIYLLRIHLGLGFLMMMVVNLVG